MSQLFFEILFYVCLSSFSNNDIISEHTPSNDEINYILTQVNKIRDKERTCGTIHMPAVAHVSWSDPLYNSAYQHAKDMVDNNYFDHISPQGGDLRQRIGKVGYQWQYIGENIAFGQKSLKELLLDWTLSESHCKILMDPNFTEMGLAKHKSKWVQHYGTPKQEK